MAERRREEAAAVIQVRADGAGNKRPANSAGRTEMRKMRLRRRRDDDGELKAACVVMREVEDRNSSRKGRQRKPNQGNGQRRMGFFRRDNHHHRHRHSFHVDLVKFGHFVIPKITKCSASAGGPSKLGGEGGGGGRLWRVLLNKKIARWVWWEDVANRIALWKEIPRWKFFLASSNRRNKLRGARFHGLCAKSGYRMSVLDQIAPIQQPQSDQNALHRVYKRQFR